MINKIKNMNKKEKGLLITLIVLIIGILSFVIYNTVNNNTDDSLVDNNDKENNNVEQDQGEININLNFELTNDEEQIINNILGDWGSCSNDYYCSGIEITKGENNTYQYQTYTPWSQYVERTAKILSGFKKTSENKYEITFYYPETSSGGITQPERTEKANIDLSKLSSNIIIVNNKEYEKITTTRDEFYLSKIIIEDSDYIYDNKINLSEINEKELKRIIDDELYLLLNEDNLKDLTNQKKFHMLVSIYKKDSKNLWNGNGFKKKILENIHENSVLNDLNIEYTDINDTYDDYLNYTNDIVFKLDKNTNEYKQAGLGGHGKMTVFYPSKLVEYKQEDNKYKVSYKYIFGSTNDGGPDLSIYKTIEDLYKRKNGIELCKTEDASKCYDNYLELINSYFDTNYNNLENELDIYTYVFEIINNKLTLTDFYRNKTSDENITSGYLLDLISEEDKLKIDNKNKFENVKVLINKIPFEFNCTGYGDLFGNYCWSTEIKLNNNVVHSYSNTLGAINVDPYIIITDKYLIIQSTDSYKINIYDKSGNNISSIKKVVHSYEKEGTNSYVSEPMYLKDNKLYFLTYNINENEQFSFHNLNEINSNYIDLTDKNFNIINNGNSFLGKISCKEC